LKSVAVKGEGKRQKAEGKTDTGGVFIRMN